MAVDPEELNEGTGGLDRDQIISMDAELFDVFDDDTDGECLGGMAIDYDSLLFDGEESIGELLGSADIESKSMPIVADKKPAAAALIKPKKKRQSLKIEHAADRGLPPPRWHSEAADKPHRKAIQMEISKLLQMRKQSPPSEAWLKQLPHKVRQLEERLYRSAPSLEAYLDRKSLKDRLKAVAKSITQHFKEEKMKRLSLQSSRSSVSSYSSFGNVSNNRDSITSIGSLDSLQTLQRMLSEKTVLPMSVGSASDSEGISERPMPQSAPLVSFTQQPATSTIGDGRTSQMSVNGNAQQQQMTETTWQHPQELAAFPPDFQHSLSIPLQLPSINIPQNSQSNFASNNMLQTPILSNTNNTSILNQGGIMNNTSLFGQPLNMMMLNSANGAQMNSALSAMQLQQRQMQYALSNQQTQMMQQQQQQQQTSSGMLVGNNTFGLGTQQNFMTLNNFMPNVTANVSMPPPPRQYQGGMSSTATAPAGTAARKGSGKKNKNTTAPR